jgi:hypothetical protein
MVKLKQNEFPKYNDELKRLYDSLANYKSAKLKGGKLSKDKLQEIRDTFLEIVDDIAAKEVTPAPTTPKKSKKKKDPNTPSKEEMDKIRGVTPKFATLTQYVAQTLKKEPDSTDKIIGMFLNADSRKHKDLTAVDKWNIVIELALHKIVKEFKLTLPKGGRANFIMNAKNPDGKYSQESVQRALNKLFNDLGVSNEVGIDLDLIRLRHTVEFNNPFDK